MGLGMYHVLNFNKILLYWQYLRFKHEFISIMCHVINFKF